MTRPTISITGGVGNQLFQWTAAHVLFESKQFNLDLHHYRINPDRVFELTPLVGQCRHVHHSNWVLEKLSIMRMLESGAYHGTPRRMLELLGYLEETRHPTDLSERIRSRVRSGLPLFLTGLFQNASLVEQGYPIIEPELTQVIENSLASMRSRFDIPERYMAVHVRRGDYPISITASNAIGQLDDNFFIELTRKTDLPILLLTEDAHEVQELSKILKPAQVFSNSDADPIHSLAIFANSDSFVGSNSSLSWWGAYLAGKRGTSSTLPREWSQWGTHENLSLRVDAIEVAPSTWKLS